MGFSLSLSDLYSIPNVDLLWRFLMDVLKFFNFSYEYLICPILPYLILYFVIFPLPVFRPTCITFLDNCTVKKNMPLIVFWQIPLSNALCTGMSLPNKDKT